MKFLKDKEKVGETPFSHVMIVEIHSTSLAAQACKRVTDDLL